MVINAFNSVVFVTVINVTIIMGMMHRHHH